MHKMLKPKYKTVAKKISNR